MNRQDWPDEDLLRRFINPGRIEKAPEGFTSKTLTRIQIEAQSAKLKRGFFARNRVPLISASLTAALILIATVIPANDPHSAGSVIWQYFRSIEFTLPRIYNNYIRDLSLPVWLIYAFTAFLLLAIFDRALSGIFHKEN